jgi:dipeptidyl aminopeptidase/acylaminoacyl peptidase
MIGASTLGTAAVVSLLERMPPPAPDEQNVFPASSPITHVSASTPPTLLLHGDVDDIVPYQQSVAMEAALRRAGVPVSLVTVKGGVHGSNFGSGGKPHPQFQDVLRETVAWLDRHLKSR